MAIAEQGERTAWADRVKKLNTEYQGIVPYINGFKDPNLKPDKRATAAYIRGKLDGILSDDLPIPKVVYGPMGRLSDRGIRCGTISIKRDSVLEPIKGEAVYLKGRGFAVFEKVQNTHPLILEAEGKSVIGDSLLDMMEERQIRELARRMFTRVAIMSVAA